MKSTMEETFVKAINDYFKKIDSDHKAEEEKRIKRVTDKFPELNEGGSCVILALPALFEELYNIPYENPKEEAL